MAAIVAVHVDTCAQKSRQKEVKDTICLLSICSVDRAYCVFELLVLCSAKWAEQWYHQPFADTVQST